MTINSNGICELNATDVSKALKEYKEFQAKKGRIYSMSDFKIPRLRDFVKLFFGELNDDGYFVVPTTFKCTRNSIAKQLHSLLKGLEFHDQIEQRYCNVSINGNTVSVEYGDY